MPPLDARLIRRSGSSYRELKERNSALLREEVRLGALEHKALPEVLTLNHTDLCNLRCIMCPRNLAQGKHRLSRRVLEHLCEELLPTAKKLTLTTAGGEPLVADFDFLIEKALRYEARVDVVTNGVLLTPEIFRRARPALDHLNISIDSHVPEVYERIRLGSRFARLHEHLLSIRDERRRHPDDLLYSLSAVVMRSNLPHLAELVAFAAEMGADGVVFQPLAHEIKPTPEEDPLVHCGRETMERELDRARRAAERCGINLYLGDLGLQPVIAKPLREKIPSLLLGQGICWFLAQGFSVMYTGEVYPCCIATDHYLGNVLYDDVADIWNGPAWRALRESHYSRVGTTFCSGCLHAPHLPPRRARRVQGALRKARIAVNHVRRSAQRRADRHFRRSLLTPGVPAVAHLDGCYEIQRDLVRGEDSTRECEFWCADRERGQAYWIRAGVLHRGPLDAETTESTWEIEPAHDRPATCLKLVPGCGETFLASFESCGGLYRVELEGGAARVKRVLTLSDERSCVRQSALELGPARMGWIAGEYGVFPGARCAVLYRGTASGEGFEPMRRFAGKHVHSVAWFAPRRLLCVTTGDLPSERCLYAGRSIGGLRERLPSFAGFVAMAATERYLHFGTELREQNGFVRWTADLRGEPEYRQFPAGWDLQLRQIVVAGDGTLLALASLDDNLLGREQLLGVLFVSRDEGASWKMAHVFEAWARVPEWLEAIDAARMSFFGMNARPCAIWTLAPRLERSAER